MIDSLGQRPASDGPLKVWVEGHGWILPFGDDEARADKAAEVVATYERNEQRLRDARLPGTVNVHGDYGRDGEGRITGPVIHGSIRLVDSRRKRA